MTNPIEPIIQSNGGDLTVGRRLCSYVYGDFKVVLPEGRDGITPEQLVKDGLSKDDPRVQVAEGKLQDAYIAKPISLNGRKQGRFDIRFTRSDATIDVNAQTSDLVDSIKAAQTRVEGDTFFERDIGNGGLGFLRPGEHFALGDKVSVLLWGKVLKVPVTSIEMTGDREESWRVHVGGQVIADAAKLKKHNDELQKTLNSERAKLSNEISRVNGRAIAAQNTADTATTKADDAQSSANAAQTTADGAKEDAANAQSTADGAMNRANSAYSYAGDVDDVLKGINITLKGQGLQGDITEQLAQAARTGNQSQDWINKNQAAWNVLQQAWNDDVDGWRATQDKINNNRQLFESAQEEINRLQNENNEQQQYILDSYLSQQQILNGKQTIYAYLDKYNASWTDGNIFFQLVDGNIQMALLDAKDENGEGRDSNLPAEVTFTLYGATGGPRVFYTSNVKQQFPDMSGAGKVEKAVILINHKPGEPKYIKKTSGYSKTTGAWQAVNDLTFKAPESSSYNVRFKIGFSEVRYKENIGYRIVKKGLSGEIVLADFYGKTSRDYLERKEELRMISVPNVSLSQGETIEFQARHSGVNKEIFGAETTISYVSTKSSSV